MCVAVRIFSGRRSSLRLPRRSSAATSRRLGRPAVPPRDAEGEPGLPRGDQLRDCAAVTGNDYLLALFDQFEQAGELGLGSMHIDPHEHWVIRLNLMGMM